MKKSALFLLLASVSSLYTQEAASKPSVAQAYSNRTEKIRAKWKYNPFRNKKDSEGLLLGWQDPNAFVSRFFVGGIINPQQLFQNTKLNTDDILTAYAPTIATEAAPIAFQLNRLKMRIGVGFLAELKLHIYKYGKRQYYGNSMFLSDFLNVSLFIDFIIDDVWKLRFIPVLHNCAHGNTEYYLSPWADAPKELVDMGTESMAFELYRNWAFLTAYGGFKFAWNGPKTSSYSTLFGAYLGMDFRVPIWGYLNFVTGFFIGADYDQLQVLSRTASPYKKDGYVLHASERHWYLTAALGVGFEIDRVTVSFKYSRMRSRHVTSFRNIDSTYGAEATLFF